ncbi:MAG: type IV toxin-antitoxin system AbiEi family antitoxin domain-containing protein [Elusimicrobiota bacterium]
MNFNNFKAAIKELPVFTGKDAARLGERQTMYNQLNNWRRKGLIIQLKRGLYVIGKADRKVEPSNLFLSGQLYAPSYVSLEYALGLHGLIPEMVTIITAVTTKNVASFKTELGNFEYQHIKREAFRGFKAAKDPVGLTYFLAEPEKAIVDFIYLNLPRFKRGDREVFTQSYRFQNLEALSLKKLKTYAGLFATPKLVDVINEFCRFAREAS